MLADVCFAFGDEGTRVGGDEMDSRDETGIDDAFGLLFGNAFSL